MKAFFRGLFTCLQVLAFIAAIISAAVIVFVNFHQPPADPPKGKLPPGWVGYDL